MDTLLVVSALAVVAVFGALVILSLLVAEGRIGPSVSALRWMLVFACALLIVVVVLLLRALVLP